MAAKIISTSTLTGVSLASTDNPVTVTPSGYVSGGDYGIGGAVGTSFTITNQNTVKATVKYGITLGQGGTITNATGALITGPFEGVLMQNGAATPGSVSNYGSITGTGPAAYGIYIHDVGTISNKAAGVITGSSGIKISGTNAVVSNLGHITGTYANSGYGVFLANSGILTNGQAGATSTATIEGYNGAALNSNPITLPGTVYNYGTIIGTGNLTSALTVAGGGKLINGGGGATGALLQGGRYGAVFGVTATVTNFATVEATGGVSGDYGIALGSGLGPATLSNLGSHAYISGYDGVTIQYGTLTNSGTIVSTQGASGTAVSFVSYGHLIVDPGAVFVGTVAAGGTLFATGLATNSSTIELAGNVASTLTNLGTSFANFGTVVVDAGALWTLNGPIKINDTAATGSVAIGAGASLDVVGVVSTGDTFALNGGTLEIGGAVNAASSFNLSGGTADVLQLDAVTGTSFNNAITGFGAHDTITLPGVTFATTASVTSGAGSLKVPLLNGGTFTFASVGTMGTPTFQVSAHTLVDAACFAAGTRIRTARGEVAVEALCVGDIAVLADGDTAPIIWIGHRAVDCRRHPNPDAVRPVRVAAGALGLGLPERDLVLSPDHALYLHEVLIPVRLLINGDTIARQPRDHVVYYHVELPRHDLLLVEGVAAESYLEAGDRSSFAGGAVASLIPDFTARRWEMAGCAPLVLAGPKLAAARAEINARADLVIAQASKNTVSLAPCMWMSNR